MIAAIIRLKAGGRDVTGSDSERPGNVPIRAWRVMMKHTWQTAAEHYVTVYLPLHFTKAAFFRYPGVYKKRTYSYFRRNRIGKIPPGPNRKEAERAAVAAARAAHEPLVFKGTLRRVARAANVKAYQTRAVVKILKLPYVARNAKRTQPDIIAELSVVNPLETEALRKLSQKTLFNNLKRFVNSRTLPVLAN